MDPLMMYVYTWWSIFEQSLYILHLKKARGYMHWLMRVFKNVSSRYIAGFLNILLLHFELKHFEKKKKKKLCDKNRIEISPNENENAESFCVHFYSRI